MASRIPGAASWSYSILPQLHSLLRQSVARLSQVLGEHPPHTWSTAARARWLVFRAYHHHRAVGLAEHALGDAPRQSAPYPTETAASHYDQAHLQFVGQAYYLLGHHSHPQVGLGHSCAGDLHPPGE